MLKHWQIFLLWFLSAIIFQRTINTSFWIFTTIIYGLIMIGWIYSIGKVLNKIDNTNKIQNYHEDFWFGLAISFFILLGYFSRSASASSNLTFFVVTILEIFCIFKLVNFSAKSLKQKKENRDLKFTDYLGEFILICCIGIGFWIIQPKLNMLIKTNENQTPNA